jgi:hypothetical protein
MRSGSCGLGGTKGPRRRSDVDAYAPCDCLRPHVLLRPNRLARLASLPLGQDGYRVLPSVADVHAFWCASLVHFSEP